VDTVLLHNAVMLIDKPEGTTSFDVIRRMRKQLHVKKAGHCGTLDKRASGLLVVCTGNATRLTTFLVESQKEYVGTVQLGAVTDTCDSEGMIIEKRDVPSDVFEEIHAVKEKYSGVIEQVPPEYSALKIGGKRASDRVRSGESLQMKPRTVEIHSLVVEEVDRENARIVIRVSCSRGTYIRALARDIGVSLGTGAYLSDLRRVRSGNFRVENAVTPVRLDEILAGGEDMTGFAMSPYQALEDFGSVTVTSSRAEKVRHGAPIRREDVERITRNDGKYLRVLDPDGNLLAVGELEPEPFRVKYRCVFPA